MDNDELDYMREIADEGCLTDDQWQRFDAIEDQAYVFVEELRKVVPEYTIRIDDGEKGFVAAKFREEADRMEKKGEE